MPTYAANLSTLWTDLPVEQRPAAAAGAGFEWVEILFPYDIDAAALRGELTRRGLGLALINGPPPNYAGGPRGFAAVPGGEGRFATDLRRVLRYAGLLKPRHVHLMAGTAEGPAARAAYVANLRAACAAAPEQSFTIEPLAPEEAPGYFLTSFDLALDVIAEVGAPNLGLQFDAYHAHLLTGDVIGAWEAARAAVRHVQFADAPGRGPPGSGRIDLPGFLARLDADGYDGIAAAEYRSDRPTEETLCWMPPPEG